MTSPSSGATSVAAETGLRSAGADNRGSEPQGTWPPNPRTVQLYVLAVLALSGPWIWWALR